MEKTVITDREKEIIKELKHKVYTMAYIQYWLKYIEYYPDEHDLTNISFMLRAMEVKGFYEAVKRMAACSSHSGEWIPCSERLPENNQSVLVYLESRTIRGGHIHSIGGYQNNVWFIRSGVETESYPNSEWNVIAWMPLPEPYKEVGV